MKITHHPRVVALISNAEELTESFKNGNRVDVAQTIALDDNAAHGAALALMIGNRLDDDERDVLLRLLLDTCI